MITDFGRFGVQLFFIISGFLAAKGLANNREKISTYYKKRAIHILPLYVFSIIWFFITETILNPYLHQIPIDDKGLYWWRYILFLNGFVNSDTYFWSNLGITWTIPVFVWFYLLIPFICKRIKGLKSAIVIGVAIRFVLIIANHFYPCNVFLYFWVFFLGIIAYYSIQDDHGIECSVIFQALSIPELILGRHEISYCLTFTSILILFLLIEKRIRLPKKITDIVTYLDKRTYTLYLVHGIVFCSLIDRLYLFNTPNWLKGVIAIVLSAIGTVLVYRFYEKPIQKWLTLKMLKKKGQ